MKVLLLTNEYPPYTYGGAGVHVEYLSRELAKLMQVDVRGFGDQRVDRGNLTVRGFDVDASAYSCPQPLRSVFGAVQRCTDFNSTLVDADLVHCHTWYTHFGGILAKKNYGIPLVITVHSLEPLRPWKREQLAAGYYSYLWSEVLDADTVEWMKQHGGLKRENGDRFREVLLSRGGSAEALTLFKNFVGRDPYIEPLLERRGLTKTPAVDSKTETSDPAKP